MVSSPGEEFFRDLMADSNSLIVNGRLIASLSPLHRGRDW